ncbi:sensor domain-containing diguanylate cyclase [Enterovibrio calviensis]|uniref:sensor domain-containing diguanylate cyclase n=1 Tax=Enterovibrio calviensis TaxID=91359 RepID=UPI00373551D3
MHLYHQLVTLALTAAIVLWTSASVAMPTVSANILTVTNSHSWKPFAFVEDGEPKGLLVDYWRLYGDVNQVPVEFILSDWNDSLEHVAQGGRKVHAGLLYSSSRDHFLDYTLPLFEISASLYIANDSEQLKTPNILPEMEIGVVRGGYEEEYLKSRYPLVKLVGFDNNAKLIEAGLNGQVNRMLLDTQVATYYLSQRTDPYQFIPIDILYTKMIYAAVPEGNEALRDEIIAGMKNIPQTEITRIEQKWLNTSHVFTVPAWVWPLGLVLIALVTFSYIVLLRQTVQRKTRDLKALNKKLEAFAFTDSLTGLLNRRGLEKMFEGRKVKALMKSRQLAVLMIDVDHFKRINDNFGHRKGDEVLIGLGKAFEHSLKEGIALSRLGGEEFCLLLEVKNRHHLDAVTEYIRCRLVPSASQRELGLEVNASIGAVLVDTKRGHLSLDSLIHQADKLMYLAKAAGRNSVKTKSLSSEGKQHHAFGVLS